MDKNLVLDLRRTLYGALKLFAIIAVISVLLKVTCCDTIAIKTDQMAPAVIKGDRVILSKKQYALPFKLFFKPQYDNIVVFRHPHAHEAFGCLRIVGMPGDTISISNGLYATSGNREIVKKSPQAVEDLVPAEYSPRDNLLPLYIPKKGDTLLLNTLSIRNLLFLYSIIQQENPGGSFILKPQLAIDDSVYPDFLISDFIHYTGKFSAIPDTLYNDWIFWSNLKNYLTMTQEKKKIDLSFIIEKEGSAITSYTIRNTFYFLLSDDWDRGYDSRYFGPVQKNLIIGKASAILWSLPPGKRGGITINMRRICKLIK